MTPIKNIKNSMNDEHYNRYYFAADFMSGQKILDAACGEGGGSCLLSKEANEVFGIDLREGALEYAKKSCDSKNIKFIAGNVVKLPFEENFFDGAVSFETIEHLNESDQETFLSELNRVVKPGGKIIISTPDKNSWRKLGLRWDDHLCELDFKQFGELLGKYFSVKEYFRQGRVLDNSSVPKVAARNSINFIKNLDVFDLRHRFFPKRLRSNIDNLTKLVDTSPEICKMDSANETAVTIIAVCDNR